MNEQPQRPIQDQPRVEQGTIPHDTRTQTSAAQPGAAQTEDTGFLPDDRMASLRERWDTVQAGFVDDPQNAVQQAHGLVTELVDSLVQTFTQERTTLENQWKGGGTADTETLRVALQRYRSFFNRLLGT
jgi:hypothetical protein